MSVGLPTIRGLDSIRFICAIWVVISHYGVARLPTDIVDKSTLAGFAVNGLYNNALVGPAAVIVFFVISGFCIHYPQSVSLVLVSHGSYYIRRYLRILPPLGVAILLASKLFGYELQSFENSIFWSLIAELFYYTLYPAMLWVRRHVQGWREIIILSFACAAWVVMTNPEAGDYPSYGRHLNWLLGLPCWLLGCWIAERVHRLRRIPTAQEIWVMRLSVWIVSVVCSVLRFHSPLGYPWTLNLFSILVAFWLLKEIEYHRIREPWRSLEWLGSWSYSLYLVHGLAIFIWTQKLADPGYGGSLGWFIGFLFILSYAFLFSRLVEVPSHQLARRIGHWLSARENILTHRK